MPRNNRIEDRELPARTQHTYGSIGLALAKAAELAIERTLGVSLSEQARRERMLDRLQDAIREQRRIIGEATTEVKRQRMMIETSRAMIAELEKRELPIKARVLVDNPGWRSRRQRSRAFARASAGGG